MLVFVRVLLSSLVEGEKVGRVSLCFLVAVSVWLWVWVDVV